MGARIATLVTAGALVGVLALALDAVAPGAPSGGGARAAGAPVASSARQTIRPRRGRAAGRHISLARLRRAPRPSPRVLEWRTRGDEEGEGGAPRPPAPETGAELVDPKTDPPLPRADGAPRARAADDSGFRVFRSSVVLKGAAATGTGVAGLIAEPAAANDRNGILTTGNDFIGLSSDNGLSYRFLDPNQTFPASAPGGSFCCDQVVAEEDRDGYSLLMWVGKNFDDGNTSAVTLSVMQGRPDLLDAQSDLSNVCEFTLTPRDFAAGQDSNRELDFPQIATTDGHAVITVDVNQIDPGFLGSRRVGSSILRLSLDAIEAACDHSSPDVGFVSVLRDTTNPILPVDNAGSTMFMAEHTDSATTTDKLRVYSWPDSSSVISIDTIDIENWPSLTKKQKCKMSNGSNPCARSDGRLRMGFRSGSTVGWVWTAAQGGAYDWPYMRIVAFDTGTLAKVEDRAVYSDEAAVAYPSVGVNSEGDVGVTYYKMGGSTKVQARAFIVTNAREWSVSTNKLLGSTNTPVREEWGDYASVHAYDNCDETFLAAIHTLQGGGGDASVEVRNVMFANHENDGCPDLDITGLDWTGDPGSVTQRPLGKITISSTTRNSGFVDTGHASRTAYYLSRDLTASSDDIRLSPTNYVPPTLGKTETDVHSAAYTIPLGTAGIYYVVACADDNEKVSEISDTNNCASEPSYLVDSGVVNGQLVVAGSPAFDSQVRPVSSVDLTSADRIGLRIPLQATGSRRARLASESLRVDVAATRDFRAPGVVLPLVSARALSSPRAAGRDRVRQTRVLTLRIPTRLRGARLFVRVCLRHPRGTDDGRFANDCRILPRAVALRR